MKKYSISLDEDSVKKAKKILPYFGWTLEDLCQNAVDTFNKESHKFKG